MRDPDRIYEMLELLGKIWIQLPDWRLGQLVVNLARGENGNLRDAFVIEDDELLEKMREIVKNTGV